MDGSSFAALQCMRVSQGHKDKKASSSYWSMPLEWAGDILATQKRNDTNILALSKEMSFTLAPPQKNYSLWISWQKWSAELTINDRPEGCLWFWKDLRWCWHTRSQRRKNQKYYITRHAAEVSRKARWELFTSQSL